MARRRGTTITRAQAEALDWPLSLGPQWDADTSTEELAAAWELLRDDMLGNYRRTQPGRRPWAWWRFDAREEYPFMSKQLDRLIELGQVDEDERQRAVARLTAAGYTLPTSSEEAGPR